MHVFYGTGTLEILNISQNKLQDLPLHVFYGTVYLEILNMSRNQLIHRLRDDRRYWAMSPFPPPLQRHLRLTLLTLRRASIHSLLPHPTSTTTTTPTTTLGHPALPPLGKMPSPIFPRERTVHTVYFKIWDPDSPARSLYVEEINQQGIVRQFDPEHFFHKLTGDHIQANQMSDYWRSHYGLPLKHGGTPFQPTWACRRTSCRTCLCTSFTARFIWRS